MDSGVNTVYICITLDLNRLFSFLTREHSTSLSPSQWKSSKLKAYGP